MEMELVYKMITDVNGFTKGMQAAQRESKKTEKDLDDLIRKLELQQKTAGQSGRQQELAALASRGAGGEGTAAKFGFAQTLADQLDAQEKATIDKAKADRIATEEAERSKAAMDRQAEAGFRLLASLEADKIALKEGAAAAKIFEIQMSNLSQVDKEAAISIIQQNEATRQKAAADKEASTATEQSKAAMDRQAEAGFRLLASLEADKIALKEGAAAAKIFEIQMSNLSKEDKEAAIALVQQNAATKQKAADDALATAQMEKATVATNRQTEAGKKLVAQLQQEHIALTQGAQAAKIYEIQNSELTDQAKQEAIALLQKNAAVKQGTADDIAATAAMDHEAAVGDKLVRMEQERRMALTMSSTAIKTQNIINSEATQSDKDRTLALMRENDELERYAAQHLKASTVTRGTVGAMNQMAASSNKNLFAIQALAFGVQDFAQVYGTMGLAGGLSAAANNLIFMTSILSPHLAIVTAVGVAVGQLASVMVPLYFNTNNAKKAMEEKTKADKEALDVTLEMAKAQHEFNQALSDGNDRNGAKGIARNVDNRLADINAEITARREELQLTKARRDAAADQVNRAARGESFMGRKMAEFGFRDRPGQAELGLAFGQVDQQVMEIEKLERKRQQLEKQKQVADANFGQKDQEARAADARKKTREEELKRDQDFFRDKEQRQKAEADAQKQFLTERRQMEREHFLESLNETDQKKAKVLEDLAEQKAKIQQWQKEDRISPADANRMSLNAQSGAAKKLTDIDLQAAEQDERERKQAMQKKQQREQGVKDLTAIEVNSSEGFKRVFDALQLGPQQALDPQREMVTLTGKSVVAQEAIKALLEKDAKKKPLKVVTKRA